MCSQSLQRTDEAAFRVRSSKWRLLVYSRLQVCSIVAFLKLWHRPLGGRSQLLLRHTFGGERIVAEDGIELLRS